MKLNALAALAASVLALGSAGSASAAIVQFTDYRSNDTVLVLPVVTASDATAGKIDVSISLDPSSPESGLMTGFFFDLGGYANTGGLGFAPGTVIRTIATDTRNIGGGANLNGTGQRVFDIGVGFGKQRRRGPKGIDISSPFTFSIDIAGTGLTLADFDRIGLRFQSVTTNGVGTAQSDKVYSTTLAAVPLPASMLLLLGALAGLGVVMRSRAASTRPAYA